tara:strand:- start:923 stop:1147 length:225 start_codon:yes stop_codon:yes gene_type:complete
MTEKSVRELEKELKNARMRDSEEHRRTVTKNRDFSVGGIDKDTTVEKKIPDTADVPDAILLPKRRRQKKENIPW